MEPLRETQKLIEELESYGDVGTAESLRRMARVARRIVPDLVGMSLGIVEERLTFTLVASSEEMAQLDAVQYLDGGPCVQAIDENTVVNAVPSEDPLDERTWQMYARATAAVGVCSSLSLPILHDEAVVGGINLYAASPGAFEGRVEQLGTALGASAENAVANADLDFSSRLRAQAAGERLAEMDEVNIAVGVISTAQRIGPEEALRRLRDAAARAGISERDAARVIVQFLRADR